MAQSNEIIFMLGAIWVILNFHQYCDDALLTNCLFKSLVY